MVHHHNQVSSDYADWLTVPAKQFQSTDKVNGDAVPNHTFFYDSLPFSKWRPKIVI